MMIKMKQWFYNTKFFKICKAVLVFLMGALFCFAPLCVSAYNYSDTASYSFQDYSGVFYCEYLVSSDLGGAYTWTDYSTIGGSVSWSGLVDPNKYVVFFQDFASYYCRGIRIYGCFLGRSENNLLFTFEGLNYNSDLDLDVSSLSMGYAVKSPGGQYNYNNGCTYGVSSYDEEYSQYSATLSVPGNFVSGYEVNSTSYEYNSFIEFDFTPLKFGTNRILDFTFYFNTNSNYGLTPFNQFLFSLTDSVSYLTLSANPVLPVADFINGTKLNQFLGSNLSLVLNPFIPLFFSGSMNSAWLGLCSFAFGMFVLVFLIAMLRRVKK